VVVADGRSAVREALRHAADGSAVSVVGEAATVSGAVATARALRPETLAAGTALLLLRPLPRPHEVPQENRMVMPKVIELKRGCAHALGKRCDAATPTATRKG
jgi:hypothetical protein